MKNITLYKPNGDTLTNYRDITGVDTEDGVLRFRRERKPNDPNSMEAITTNLPFIIADDMEG